MADLADHPGRLPVWWLVLLRCAWPVPRLWLSWRMWFFCWPRWH